MVPPAAEGSQFRNEALEIPAAVRPPIGPSRNEPGARPRGPIRWLLAASLWRPPRWACGPLWRPRTAEKVAAPTVLL